MKVHPYYRLSRRVIHLEKLRLVLVYYTVGEEKISRLFDTSCLIY